MPETTPHPCDLYAELRTLYALANTALFADTLPPCMILLRAKRTTLGYFQPTCWSRALTEGPGEIDAIALNTEAFTRHTEADILSTLVHEMVHLWQQHYGDNVPKRNYHNREWATKMTSLGLMPSRTGKPGGKQTGTNCSHYILEPGAFHDWYATIAAIPPARLLTWHERPKLIPKNEQPKKLKYVCPRCSTKAWAVEDTKLLCGDCTAPMFTIAAQIPLFTPTPSGAALVDMTTGEVRDA